MIYNKKKYNRNYTISCRNNKKMNYITNVEVEHSIFINAYIF
jgi:hypothetical protein